METPGAFRRAVARAGFFTVVTSLLLTGCERPPSTQASTDTQTSTDVVEGVVLSRTGDPWTAFRDEYLSAYFRVHPVFATMAGRHEADGRLPDWSAAGITAEIQRLKNMRERATAFGDTTLSAGQRFEREYLLSRIDRDLFWIETAGTPFHNPTFYLGDIDGLDPAVYLTRDYAPLEQRMRAYIRYARAVPRAVEQIRSNLKLPLARTVAERGISGFKGLADFYRDDVPRVFASIQDARLNTDFKQANAQAETSLRDLAGWLEKNLPGSHQRFALGAEKFARMLAATEGVTTPLADLESKGRADLERNLAALAEACRDYAPGETLRSCIGRMQRNKPVQGPVRAARDQLEGLKAFIEERGLVSIPGTEEALVREAPPYNRANSAYIDIPGPYEKGLPAIYYIAPPDPAWTKREQQAYIPGIADLLFTSVHEVWPGHFLQFLHSNRSPSIVGRLFVGYAFAEGWAHYAEELMWEVGFNAGDLESRIGQLGNALLRNVRFLSAIGLHTGAMTVAESEKMFVEKAFSDPGTARQQAARGTYDPAYLNYTMGKLMILKLREDWCAPRGGRAAWRDFHDKFLSYGGPPIPMVRAAMLGNSNEKLF